MKYNNKLFCFSPGVMLATFLIEIALFAYTIWRYKMNTTTRLASSILFFLATFQMAEFISCGSVDYVLWSKIGFVAITALPPLCIHLILSLAKKKNRKLLFGTYLAGAIFTLLFLMPGAFANHICGGNYVIFRLVEGLSDAYMIYYYGLLTVGIWLAYTYSKKARKPIRKALHYQVFGYLSFMVPTAIANSINPETGGAIPSIMCGFAVIYALTIVFGILPASRQPINK